jgi:hypothetical protein
VLQTLKMHDGGLPFCLVAMDKDVPTTGVLFDTGEIEANLVTTADRERSRHES